MKFTGEEVKRLYQQETARSVAGRANCLLEDAMTRAAAGELSRQEREMTADHMTGCSNCAQEYRLLRRLNPLTRRADVSVYEMESVVEPAIGELDEEDRVVTAQPDMRRRLIGIFSPGHAAYAVATALMVISLTGAAWVISLRRESAKLTAQLGEQLSKRDQTFQLLAETRRQLDESRRRAEEQQKEIAGMRRSVEDLSQPQINALITDLEPQSARGDTGGEVATVTAPAGARLFTLILHVAGGSNFPDYELEILDGQGQRVWRARGLRRSQADFFTVTLPRQLLPAGRYRLRLYGLRVGRSESVGDYAVRVRY